MIKLKKIWYLHKRIFISFIIFFILGPLPTIIWDESWVDHFIDENSFWYNVPTYIICIILLLVFFWQIGSGIYYNIKYKNKK